MRMIKCRGECGKIITIEDGKQYEVDTNNNNRITSVEHTPKRCMELLRCRKGLKPRPVSETTLDSF